MQKTNEEWITRWAGSYTFISCSYWGPAYHKTLKRILGKGFDTTLFIHKKGTVTFLVKKDELDSLGTYLSKKSKEEMIELLNKLKENTDLIMPLMDQLSNKIMRESEYRKFIEIFDRHLAYHVFMKKTVDYLPKDILDEMLPSFKEARLYSEAVYSRTEKFFRDMAKAIGEKENISPELLTCLTEEEIERYIIKQSLPDKNILKERFDSSILLSEDGSLKIILGDEARKLEESIRSSDNDTVKGHSVFPGLVTGRCRIITDPHAETDFQQGDILVTGMTRPEFTKFYAKAAAIVTDVGGRLCHAALIAMEMGKPCVVGTEKATIIFKDKEMIQVDATNGTIRKVK